MAATFGNALMLQQMLLLWWVDSQLVTQNRAPAKELDRRKCSVHLGKQVMCHLASVPVLNRG